MNFHKVVIDNMLNIIAVFGMVSCYTGLLRRMEFLDNTARHWIHQTDCNVHL